MNRSKTKTKLVTVIGLAFAGFACGGSPSSVDAELLSPESSTREAEVQLTPAIDFSDLFDASLADRIAIDEIIINVSDVRLLGIDPRIPTGGLALVSDEHQLVAGGQLESLGRFPFPSSLANEDLAIYVRVSPTPQLDGSSVIVRGRLFANADDNDSIAQKLVSDDKEPEEETGKSALDPDGEPADRGGRSALDPDGEPAAPTGDGALDPDGEPAAPSGSGNMDPDGEPAHCEDAKRCFALVSKPQSPSVSFELRGDHSVELQVLFDHGTTLDVLLGIPAARWLTPEAVGELEMAFDRTDVSQSSSAQNERVDDVAVVIQDSSRREQVSRASNAPSNEGRIDGECNEYSLISRDDIQPGSIRGR